MRQLRTVLTATAGTALLFVSTVAAAQGEDAWQFSASIYGYLPSLSGTTKFPANGGGSEVSVDSGTILDNLKFTFMGSFEARQGQWGGFTDVIYLDLGNTKTATRDLTIGNVQLPAGASAKVEYDLKGWLWTLAGTYRAVAMPAYTLDVLAGARMLDLTPKLDWSVTGDLGSIAEADRSGHRDSTARNWDAIVGVKGRAAFGADQTWFVPYYFDLGTGESKFTGQAMAGLGYAFRWGDVLAAWRYIDYQTKSGSNIERLSLSGPMIAATFRW
ncbi:MAG TPA: hypothetical protein VMT50_04285 [Steroidobacteraceae bacterium]|nr:hypothetical protein [Steroidobacteraceae bacterium]